MNHIPTPAPAIGVSARSCASGPRPLPPRVPEPPRGQPAMAGGVGAEGALTWADMPRLVREFVFATYGVSA